MSRFLAAAALVALSACQSLPGSGPSGVASLQPTTKGKASGTVTFTQVAENRVRVTGTVTGLAPGREHGFHIHEAGDCSSGDGMSAKGHFNPFAKPHGNPMAGEHHAGDLPALKADATGTATVDAQIEGISVAPGPASIVGRGLIVHADPDDYKTQPTGNAGARIACAVIQRT